MLSFNKIYEMNWVWSSLEVDYNSVFCVLDRLCFNICIFTKQLSQNYCLLLDLSASAPFELSSTFVHTSKKSKLCDCYILHFFLQP